MDSEITGQIEWFEDLREAITNDPDAAIEAVDAAIHLLSRADSRPLPRIVDYENLPF